MAKVGMSNPDHTISLKRLQCVVGEGGGARRIIGHSPVHNNYSGSWSLSHAASHAV